MSRLFSPRRRNKQNTDVTNMEDDTTATTLYKCQCGIYFATLAAAKAHACSDSEKPHLDETSFDEDSKTLFQCENCSGFFEDRQVFEDHECVRKCNEDRPSATATGTSTILQDAAKNVSAASWGSAETKLLITLYKTHEKSVMKGPMRKKSMWDIISNEMLTYGHRFTSEQVSGRWKSLMRAYKTVKDNNKKSGMGRKTYEFENELDEIFENDPIMTPQFVMSSSRTSEDSENRKRSNEVAATCSDNSGTGSPSNTMPVKKPRCANTSKEIIEVFKSFVQDQKSEKERREQMHKEKMEVMGSLINVLKDLK